MVHNYLQMKTFDTYKPVKLVAQAEEDLMTGKKDSEA